MKHAIAAVLICAVIPFAASKADAIDKQVIPTQPCAAEGDNFCIWDAKHMGNGQGHSYMAFKDGTWIRITHHWAHKRLAKVGAV